MNVKPVHRNYGSVGAPCLGKVLEHYSPESGCRQGLRHDHPVCESGFNVKPACNGLALSRHHALGRSYAIIPKAWWGDRASPLQTGLQGLVLGVVLTISTQYVRVARWMCHVIDNMLREMVADEYPSYQTERMASTQSVDRGRNKASRLLLS